VVGTIRGGDDRILLQNPGRCVKGWGFFRLGRFFNAISRAGEGEGPPFTNNSISIRRDGHRTLRRGSIGRDLVKSSLWEIRQITWGQMGETYRSDWTHCRTEGGGKENQRLDNFRIFGVNRAKGLLAGAGDPREVGGGLPYPEAEQKQVIQ